MIFSKERLTEARKAAGLTQDELARKAGTIQQAVYKWESGTRTPGAKSLRALAEALEKPVEHFLVDPMEEFALRERPVGSYVAHPGLKRPRTVMEAIEELGRAQSELSHAQARLKAASEALNEALANQGGEN
jgi:transcriptional regulator with XRE-family HTH domain